MIIKRIFESEKETLGILTIGSFRCFTLELPYLENKRNVSCIPEGDYEYFKRVSPSRGLEVIQLRDVPNRSFIQIHPGNYTKQIQGCILPGLMIKDINLDSVFDVGNSTQAFDKIMALAGDSGVLTVMR